MGVFIGFVVFGVWRFLRYVLLFLFELIVICLNFKYR